MDLYHTEEERSAVVEDFIQKLVDSGYNLNHRQEILRSGCRKFCRRQIEHPTGGKPLYWKEAQIKAARKVKKTTVNSIGSNLQGEVETSHQGKTFHI